MSAKSLILVERNLGSVRENENGISVGTLLEYKLKTMFIFVMVYFLYCYTL